MKETEERWNLADRQITKRNLKDGSSRLDSIRGEEEQEGISGKETNRPSCIHIKITTSKMCSLRCLIWKTQPLRRVVAQNLRGPFKETVSRINNYDHPASENNKNRMTADSIWAPLDARGD
ncbi:hypothetical protein CHS0354_008245 [Potamilus streckersoni]|uniref:Uncharacterized protein n=1 Tax=Potamilus streckersoni TaxID=2493646 RepID=A0AAE0T6F7_9BIVA|nr:hypothetical protein CHS0354_008245 [Potamilus streckersoni]